MLLYKSLAFMSPSIRELARSIIMSPQSCIETACELMSSPMPPSTDVPGCFGLPRISTAYDVTGCEGMMSSWKYISSWRIPNVSPWFEGAYQQLFRRSSQCLLCSLKKSKDINCFRVVFFVCLFVCLFVLVFEIITHRANAALQMYQEKDWGWVKELRVGYS